MKKVIIAFLCIQSFSFFAAQQNEKSFILLDFSEFQNKNDVRDIQLIFTSKKYANLQIIRTNELDKCYYLNTNDITNISITITQLNGHNKKVFAKFMGGIWPGFCYKFLYKHPDTFKKQQSEFDFEPLAHSLCQACKDKLNDCNKLN